MTGSKLNYEARSAIVPTAESVATFMLAAGVPARTIMEVLGHSEISVTMNTYTHALAQLRQDAPDAIDKVLGT